jgi:hypothetical protein
MWLAGKIVDSDIGVLSEEYEMTWFPGDNLLAATRPRGLPIGNLTSQFWANCYLNPFDYFIKRELGCKAYLRFVDDFALFADDKVVLWQWRQSIVERLARLRLTIHPAAQPRKVSKGLSFLGFLVFSERRRLKRRKGIHYRQRLNLLVLDYVAGKLSFDQLAASVRGWVNHARYGNTVGLRKAVLLQTVIPARKEAL